MSFYHEDPDKMEAAISIASLAQGFVNANNLELTPKDPTVTTSLSSLSRTLSSTAVSTSSSAVSAFMRNCLPSDGQLLPTVVKLASNDIMSPCINNMQSSSTSNVNQIRIGQTTASSFGPSTAGQPTNIMSTFRPMRGPDGQLIFIPVVSTNVDLSAFQHQQLLLQLKQQQQQQHSQPFQHKLEETVKQDNLNGGSIFTMLRHQSSEKLLAHSVNAARSEKDQLSSANPEDTISSHSISLSTSLPIDSRGSISLSPPILPPRELADSTSSNSIMRANNLEGMSSSPLRQLGNFKVGSLTSLRDFYHKVYPSRCSNILSSSSSVSCPPSPLASGVTSPRLGSLNCLSQYYGGANGRRIVNQQSSEYRPTTSDCGVDKPMLLPSDIAERQPLTQSLSVDGTSWPPTGQAGGVTSQFLTCSMSSNGLAQPVPDNMMLNERAIITGKRNIEHPEQSSAKLDLNAGHLIKYGDASNFLLNRTILPSRDTVVDRGTIPILPVSSPVLSRILPAIEETPPATSENLRSDGVQVATTTTAGVTAGFSSGERRSFHDETNRKLPAKKRKLGNIVTSVNNVLMSDAGILADASARSMAVSTPGSHITYSATTVPQGTLIQTNPTTLDLAQLQGMQAYSSSMTSANVYSSIIGTAKTGLGSAKPIPHTTVENQPFFVSSPRMLYLSSSDNNTFLQTPSRNTNITQPLPPSLNSDNSMQRFSDSSEHRLIIAEECGDIPIISNTGTTQNVPERQGMTSRLQNNNNLCSVVKDLSTDKVSIVERRITTVNGEQWAWSKDDRQAVTVTAIESSSAYAGSSISRSIIVNSVPSSMPPVVCSIPRTPATVSSLSSRPSPESVKHPVLTADEDGDLPLHVAVVQEKVDVIERLLSLMSLLNAHVDVFNNMRQTPLHLAVITGRVDIVKLLIDAGASPNVPDRNGHNAIHLAVLKRTQDCLHALLTQPTSSNLDVSALNYEGLTPLMIAVKQDCVEIANILVVQGKANLDVADGKSGQTPLYTAADLNRLKMAEVLLSNGADPQISSYSGLLPVQVNLNYVDLARLKTAVERLLKLCISNCLAASAHSYSEMVKLLTKFGGTAINTDQAVHDGSSPPSASSTRKAKTSVRSGRTNETTRKKKSVNISAYRTEEDT